MDFIRVAYKEEKDKETGVVIRNYYPSLQALESQDLVIRGGQFVAIWDEANKLYDRRLSHVPDIIDRAFAQMVGDRLRPGDTISKVRVYDNQIYSRLMGLIRNIGDMGPELDQRLVFANETPKKEQAATFKLPYSLSNADCPSWHTIVSTLYDPEERTKIEWAIGSIFTGASLDLQKFYVFFGPPGSGKSTVMNIIEMLFAGHTAAFSAYEMARADSNFSLEPFSKNPLVAIDQDGDLSRIEVNKNLNSIVSHDRVLINAKGKNLYEIYPRACLFIGSNSPVKITDRKSGIFRRLVDIQPSGRIFPETDYHALMAAVQYELGAIATHCIKVFEELGPTYLSLYRAHDMMYRTNDIFNFIQDNRLVLEKGATLKQAHKLYLQWCEETETRNIYKQYQFRDLLADYFETFHEQIMVDGIRLRSYFEGLRELEHFTWQGITPKPTHDWLELKPGPSPMDEWCSDFPAQPSTGNDQYPLKQAWADVTTTLSDINTAEEHYVKVPENHIVIDFDLVDETGNKSLAENLKAASVWPPTYAEVSRSGKALHLHYLYDGDPSQLAAHHSPGIEIKSLLGGSSLRRRLSNHNELPVAVISSGLPLKEASVISAKTMSGERSLRKQILRGLNKEVHQYTKPSMDFIAQVLKDAEAQGMTYDVSDMWDDIFQFAMTSSNQRSACIAIAMDMKLSSDDAVEGEKTQETEKPIADFDCEVYPNLFAVGYLIDGNEEVVTIRDPSPEQCEEILTKLRLNGFNNRGYDNHIMWARTLGYTNMQLFELSQRIIAERDRRAGFGPAYHVSYSDAYDIIVDKKTLKKWEIELGLPHMEMDLPWDEPVPEDRIPDIMEYLENDVRSTRAVRLHRAGDFKAREMLAELTGLTMMHTNRQHTEKLIFGELRETAKDLEYTDLREHFPGYEFDQFKPGKDKSTYKGVNVGEGGYVYAEPGIYESVVLLDVASMHPTSIVQMNLFGKHTPKFEELMKVRLALKKGDMEEAGRLMDGRLKPYLGDPTGAKALSDALKIVINSVYGLTAASFDNKFKDARNIDNIVAKRGALFMVDLKEFVEKAGFKVVHIKTDSIKIPGATAELVKSVAEFGKQYGYEFEHEATYEKFCLVNDAVYVARVGWAENAAKIGSWETVGKQFQHPVVKKTLFTKEQILPKDYVEVKQVAKGHMYLVSEETEHRQFVGRFGAFVPVTDGRMLMRVDGDKVGAVTGTKGYLWEIDEVALTTGRPVDMQYFQELVDDGISTIEKFGSYSEFVS